MREDVKEEVRKISIKAAKAFATEIRANAEMCGATIEKLMGFAPTVMLLLGYMKKRFPECRVGINRGGVIGVFEHVDHLETFRKEGNLRSHEGIEVGDLGGVPLGDLRVGFEVADRLLQRAGELYGINGGWAETGAFLAWSFLRLLNSAREDFPGGTIGVTSPEGVFVPIFGPGPKGRPKWGIYIPTVLLECLKGESGGGPAA